MNIYKIAKKRHGENRNNRSDKLSFLVQNIISDFFIREELIDEENQIISVIINRVELSPDLKSAKIFARWFNKTIIDKEKFINILDQTSYNIHKILAKKLHIKHIPKVKFYYEDSFDSKQIMINYLENNDATKEEIDEFLASSK